MTAKATINVKQLINFMSTCKTKGRLIKVRKLPKGPTILLPRCISITPEAAWSIGFYCAEGSKMKMSIGVSNCNLGLLLRFRAYINSAFSKANPDWHVFIRSAQKDPAAKRVYTKIFESEKVRTYFTPLANTDNIEIRINSVPLSSFFHKLVSTALPIIANESELSLEFLKGYEVGDGSINVRRGFLHDINITVKNLEMKNYLKQLFYSLYGINLKERTTKNVYAISYSNIKMMTNFILDGHFSDHSAQWQKLLKAYLKKQYVRSHIRYWNAVRFKKLPVLEIVEKTGRSHWSVRDALNADAHLGLVKSTHAKTKGNNGHAYKFYELSDNGKRLLDMLDEVQK